MLKCLVFVSNEKDLKNRGAAWKALERYCNVVIVQCNINIDQLYGVLDTHHPNFVLIPGLTYNALQSFWFVDHALAETKVPFFTLWDHNPLRFLHTFDDMEYHRGMFVIDSRVAAQLRYIDLPGIPTRIYYGNQNWFNTNSQRSEHYDVVFPGTVDNLNTVLFELRCSQNLTGAAISTIGIFVQERIEAQHYIDVYDWLNAFKDRPDARDGLVHEHLCIMNNPFLPTAMMFVQKAIERKQLLDACPIPVHVFGPGRAKSTDYHPIFHTNIKKPNLGQDVYRKSGFALCCTQWPAAAHERLFEGAACQVPVLSERKADALSCFEENTEALYWDTLDEFREQTSRLHADPTLRARLAEAANKRFLSDHTPETVMGEIFKEIEARL